ncbi:WYL domain-containing protein [Companilactobacillus kimchiensis]|uniref:Uncharacterized protein n=1 Tax=Companilactobacillus kimchiensis TaxID=993692 RepID=A0A0R2L4X1_9LACO|nr:WYL domain-containing protein [Companilactobacillus kimchiensis]KRN96750.1 hypothetical protein IV57_GL001761 [Companilactobacillus kimchiensis]
MSKEEKKFVDKEETERKIKSRERIVEIIFRMLSGEKIKENEAANYYEIGPKAINNDFKFIREKLEFFTPDYELSSGPYHTITNKGQIGLTEAVAILKILIGSLAFSKAEIILLKDKFLEVIPTAEKKTLNTMTATTLQDYQSRITEPIMDKFKIILDCIINKKAIIFKYNSSVDTTDHTKERTAVPITIYFSNQHFYVLLYLKEKDTTSVYRLDRFQDINPTGHAVNIPYANRPNEGKMINETFLLNGGNYIHYKFRYKASQHVTLDNVPNSHISKDDDPEQPNITTVEGDLYSQGALLWVMSQGTQVEVLEPESLIKAVKERLKDTLKIYDK